MIPRGTLHATGRIGARGERGVVLLIALIVLVAMTLAGIGMMRSIDSGTLVAGNIGFREAAVATADTGVEAARAWLVANSTSLNVDNPAAGYYSTRQDTLDLTGNMTSGGTDGGCAGCGRVSRNTEPPPGRFSATRLPPCACAIPRQIARPRPAPGAPSCRPR